jgi:hypothetical protein
MNVSIHEERWFSSKKKWYEVALATSTLALAGFFLTDSEVYMLNRMKEILQIFNSYMKWSNDKHWHISPSLIDRNVR